jgi:hypothetical protein
MERGPVVRRRLLILDTTVLMDHQAWDMLFSRIDACGYPSSRPVAAGLDLWGPGPLSYGNVFPRAPTPEQRGRVLALLGLPIALQVSANLTVS